MKTSHKINWLNTLFLIMTPLVGVIGTVWLGLSGQFHWATAVLAVVMTFMTGFAITGGYHRLFSHQSYRCHPAIRFFFLLFGAAAFEGSVLEWSTDHRRHHRYVDTDQDPYSINKGFWFAHIGWLIHLDPTQRDYSNVEDLSADRWVRWQHRYVVLIGIVMGFLFPMGLAALWGDALGGLIMAGALRVVFNHHVTFAINSICHTFGKRTYSLVQTARDNWITALFTYGEGYHSFHHKFPIDYRNGVRAFHYDPTKWLIRLFAWLGLATDLKQVSKHRILQQQIQVAEQRLQQRLANKLQHPAYEQWLELTTTLRQHMQQALKKFELLEADYRNLCKIAFSKSLRDHHTKLQLKATRKRLKQTYAELKTVVAMWSAAHRQFFRLQYAA